MVYADERRDIWKARAVTGYPALLMVSVTWTGTITYCKLAIINGYR